MPCGTGKSLTAFWIANKLHAKSVIVAVPSLALIKQSLEDWKREFIAANEYPNPEWLVICSDESTSKLEKDEFVSDTYSLGIPTTTEIEKISSFLSEETAGRKIVFTTYQSSDKLAQASRICNYSFDLAILDESHKTVGVKSKTFATLLLNKNIHISRRIFMTATERVLRGESDEVFSMDDEDTYGELFYQLSFKEAINADPPIICDYKVLTITVTNDEIKQLIAKNKLITDEVKKIEEQKSQSLAVAVALRKATQKYGIRHAISFHRSIKSASDFSDLNQMLNNFNVDEVRLNASHISSKKSAGERAILMKDFTGEELALMTNARCLNEGVDVPAIDCVLFTDPKQSVIDIVQAAGRALRPYPSKEYGYIMSPLIVPDGLELQELASACALYVRALEAHGGEICPRALTEDWHRSGFKWFCHYDESDETQQILRNYWHYLALNWWKEKRENVVCDYMNCIIEPDHGYLIGNKLACEECCRRLVAGVKKNLAKDPDCFGKQMYERAFAFHQNKFRN